MATKIKVEITSFALSTLLGDNANSDGDQEGFLFGEVFSRKERDITDHDADGLIETTIIRITSHMFLLEPCEFYSRVGQVDEEKIKDTLGPFFKHVVGYFDFKRQLPLECTTVPGFRTTLLFRSLCDWARSRPPTEIVASPLTLLVLRQNHIGISRSTINNNYCFYHLDGASKKLVKVASEIPNLGDTSQRQYVHAPCVPGVDDVVKKYLTNTPVQPEDMPTVKAHKAMMIELEKAARHVAEEEEKYWGIELKFREIMHRTTLVEENLAELELEQGANLSCCSENSTGSSELNVSTRTIKSTSINESFPAASVKTEAPRASPHKAKTEPRITPESGDIKEESTDGLNANSSPNLSRKSSRRNKNSK